MATWKLFGKDVTTQQLPAELRSVLAQMQRERSAFETLTNGAREAAQTLTQLSQPVAEAQKTVAELQTRIKALERVMPVLATLDQQTEEVSRVQRRTETRLTQVSDESKQLRTDIQGLRDTLDEALALKNDLAGFLELGGGFKALRMDADQLTAELRDVTQGLERARERQDALRGTSDGLATRLSTFEARQVEIQTGVAGVESRALALGQTLADLSQASAEAAQTKRQLTSLRSLAEGVTQKVSALEQQRDLVDRATSQVTRLHEVLVDIDAKSRKSEESAKSLSALEAKVNDLRAVHEDVLRRSEEITAHQHESMRLDEEMRTRLASLRDEVHRTVKRFELENDGLDAVGKRIVDLRGGLTDLDTRFQSLDEASRAITDVRAKADGLTAQLVTIGETVTELETQAQEIRGMGATVGRLDDQVGEMTQRVARLEKAQPAVEAVMNDVAGLKGTHEAVLGAMEQVQAADREIARLREGQAGTKTWLVSTTEAVKTLRGEVAAVEELKPIVEGVRAEAERVSQAAGQIEGRRVLLDDLNTRLSDLTTLGTRLDERVHALVSQMDGADGRFQALSAHAEEAARIEQLVPTAVATVERAERRSAAVDATVSSLEARAHTLEDLAERTRALAQEIDLRQVALDKASGHLEHASELRTEAAHAAQQLEERTGQLTSALSVAGGRLTEVTATLDQLDSRSGGLRFAQKRIAQFEERLAKWEVVESHLTRALERVTQRQSTLDALQADMHRLFEIAERTVDDVRSIAAAKEEVTQTRAVLETVLGLVSHVHDAANGLDHRRRQVEQAEERLARVEGLLADMAANLETLRGQKALMDQVMEQAGSLEVHTKQAEALISTLRQEREITDKVWAATGRVREGGVAKTA